MSKYLNIKNGNEEVLLSDLYYQKGESVDYHYGGNTQKSKIAFGFVTTATKNCYLTIPVKKRVPSDLTCTCISLQGMIRTTDGTYLDGLSASDTQWVSSTYTIQTNSTNGEDNYLVVAITKSEAFTNVTNNTPVVMMIRDLKVTFS